MINQSEIAVRQAKPYRQHDSKPFIDAYRVFRERDLVQYAQLKFMALKDLPTVQKGIMPGPRKKWIRRENDNWIFHVKFFVLLDLADNEVREDLLRIVPGAIRPSLSELEEFEQQVNQEEEELQPTQLQKRVKITNHVSQQVKRLLKGQQVIEVQKRLNEEPNVPKVEQNDESTQLLLVESWLRDISDILMNIREKNLNIETLRELGVAGSLEHIRNQKKTNFHLLKKEQDNEVNL